MNNIKFAFFGTPRMAVTVLDELEKNNFCPSVIFCAPDKPAGRKKILTPPPAKIWALERNIPIEQPQNKKELYHAITKYTIDISLVAAYNIIIGPKSLQYASYGTLNIHPSLLPLHRGPAPIQQTILDGDTTTGVCLMQLDEDIDHGPIVACKSISLQGSETYLELEELLAKIGSRLFIDSLEGYISGTITPSAQNHSDATFSKRFASDDGRVDLNNTTVVEIDRKVRALNPEPGTWTEIETNKGLLQRVKILSGTITENNYVPKRVTPAGKNEMSWDDFIKRYVNK
ncbi:MAG: methionyl-tRNA formyltransferase [bacterium]|nr:methionyl-tRNA formyltransferase [bacterium]